MKMLRFIKSLAKTTIIAGLAVCLFHNNASAQRPNQFPFKQKQVYHVVFAGTEGIITFVTLPNKDGWATVNIEGGFRNANLQSSQSVNLNLNLVEMVEELGDPVAYGFNQEKEAMRMDLMNIATQAFQYRLRPRSMAGGEGSYAGFSIPEKMAVNKNGNYSWKSGNDSVAVRAVSSVHPKNTIDVIISENGKLVDWVFGGNFKE
jgi:hypothetical protein